MSTGTPLARRALAEHRRYVVPLMIALAVNVLGYALFVYPLAQRVANVEQRNQEAGQALMAARLIERQKLNAAFRFLIDKRSTPRPSGCVTGAQALDAFLGRLAARDSSEHTRRAYQTAITQYLDWLDEQTKMSR